MIINSINKYCIRVDIFLALKRINVRGSEVKPLTRGYGSTLHYRDRDHFSKLDIRQSVSTIFSFCDCSCAVCK